MSSVSNEQKPAKKQQKKSSLNRKIITGILKSSLVITIVIGLLIAFVLTPWGTKTIIWKNMLVKFHVTEKTKFII